MPITELAILFFGALGVSLGLSAAAALFSLALRWFIDWITE